MSVSLPTPALAGGATGDNTAAIIPMYADSDPCAHTPTGTLTWAVTCSSDGDANYYGLGGRFGCAVVPFGGLEVNLTIDAAPAIVVGMGFPAGSGFLINNPVPSQPGPHQLGCRTWPGYPSYASSFGFWLDYGDHTLVFSLAAWTYNFVEDSDHGACSTDWQFVLGDLILVQGVPCDDWTAPPPPPPPVRHKVRLTVAPGDRVRQTVCVGEKVRCTIGE